MAPYDSDSSDDGGEYTETNVLLGYATGDATGDAVSHLGGAPSWLDDKTPPSGASAKCKVCNGLLSLLLQLDGDLPQQFPGHERRLYIWTCRRKTCRRKEGSIRALRGVRIAKGASNRAQTKAEKPQIAPEDKPQPKIGESLFGVKNGSSTTAPANPFSNPFSSHTAGKAPANPFSSAPAPCDPGAAPLPSVQVTGPETADVDSSKLSETFAAKVRLSSPASEQPPRPHEPWPADPSFPEGFPRYQLEAEYETLDAPSAPQIPDHARMDIDTEGSGGGGGKEDKEVYESSIDKTFQKFADRLGQNPEQVLRYEFRGKPLLYSDTDAVGKLLAPHSENASSSTAKVTTASSRTGSGLPRCQTCGADRVFEAQLTPHAITELEAQDMSVDGMEWGTIIVGVCSKDCKPADVSEAEVGYVEEWVGVQWEEMNSKR
ncbi:programmed cell death protein 2 [Ampelomyces quisqualis]|uniref:Programmed cell death protein 2 n=1 Tax=Ampelomyces quisqualis TaxID=50730 RepID=A0A6A5R0J9_AMPQU|nr:programmed cell death protein 2 [Ampelomyces quisqualis]